MKNRLRELRENRQLHQTDVANATGINQKTLSNYENGVTDPNSYALIKLADFFNVSIDYLVGRTDTPFRDNSHNIIIKKINAISKELDDIKRLL